MKKKYSIIIVVLTVAFIMIGVFYFCLPNRPDGTTDMIEKIEVTDYTEEKLRDKLIGQYRGDILASWGEPDNTHAELNCDVYYFEGTHKSVLVIYDDKDYIERISIDKDIQPLD